MAGSRKQVAFDLDTKALQKSIAGGRYMDIRRDVY